MNKEKVIIFGTGKSGIRAYHNLKEIFDIVEFWDNNKEKDGTFLFEIPVTLPRSTIMNIDKIIICSVYYKEIHHQLTANMKIDYSKIDNEFYYDKKQIQSYYRSEENNEIKEVMDYLSNHELDVFNYKFREKYMDLEIEVFFDEESGFHYVLYNEKRMYFKKSMTEDEIKNYYKSISKEQDIESPHRYLLDKWHVKKGDVVIDAGVAEGNFALSIIDKAEKVFLVESDIEWIEALEKTFSKWKEKVVIIPKFLSDIVDEENITIDEIGKNQPINYIKLDIEGAEVKALLGGEKSIKGAKDLKMAVCAYHNQEDELMISDILYSYGVETEPSKGYMYFSNKDGGTLCSRTLQLRRGLVRGMKEGVML